MTYAFGFCSVLYGMGSIRVIAHFLLLGSVLGKTWVLVRLILAGFGFLPISNYELSQTVTPTSLLQKHDCCAAIKKDAALGSDKTPRLNLAATFSATEHTAD